MEPTWFLLLQSLSLITEILNWQHALALNALNGNCSWWCSWTETAWGAKYQSLLCYDAVLGGWCNFFNSCFRFCAALSSLLLLCFFTQLSTSWNTWGFFIKLLYRVHINLPYCIALHLRTREFKPNVKDYHLKNPLFLPVEMTFNDICKFWWWVLKLADHGILHIVVAHIWSVKDSTILVLCTRIPLCINSW